MEKCESGGKEGNLVRKKNLGKDGKGDGKYQGFWTERMKRNCLALRVGCKMSLETEGLGR